MESTATRMLDSAEKLVQTMGFNWFSYADIAQELGVRKASLHHHFTTKGQLGLALIDRYILQFQQALEKIDARPIDAAAKLGHYAKLYEDVLRGKRICLCGMLAAEYGSLPESMQAGIRRFFDFNEAWLARIITEGRRAGEFHARGSARDVARMLMSSLEGAMLVARPYDDVERFVASAAQIIASLRVPKPVRGKRRSRA
jgi:TetR/AcrR family transcriptional regulator, transcriptional repressor for nem operon